LAYLDHSASAFLPLSEPILSVELALGAYLLCIGVNYVPLLLHAISLVRHGAANQEIADEMSEKHRMFRKDRRQSLLLLVPLVVLILGNRPVAVI
jgi:hypothetical protein